ncbi:NAD(P)-dependent oxidoreductase [Rathayibacter sp. YIM 133350]|uniref:NAD-dependent epimerase/dehydratase family protein n=1 Tax=Rathayibacter sp. YIM 133350 TaxID=3131992 RepID=UPI00307E64B4
MSSPVATGTLGSVQGRRVLVTGGDGLIGRAVVRRLVEADAIVVSLDRGGDEAASRAAALGAESYVSGSVTDEAFVRSAIRGQDAVVHLAGIPGLGISEPGELYAANALGTFLVLNAAADAGMAKAVFASSINAMGLPLNARGVLPSRYPWDEDEPADIGDPYSLSKQANEAAAAAVARWSGMQVTGLRYPLVRDITVDDGRVFARHIRAALRDEPRRQACEGWTYLDVADAAEATLAALTHDTPPAPGILVAAPRTYLRQPTDEALAAVAPAVRRAHIAGRDVPVRLDRASRLIDFQASTFLEDLDPALLADVSGFDDVERPGEILAAKGARA